MLSVDPLPTSVASPSTLPARIEARPPARAIWLPHIARPKTDVLHTNAFWEGTRELLLTWFWLMHGLKIRGLHNVPSRGPVIFAPNHVSYYDPPLIAACVPYRVRTMAWEKLFTVPGLQWLIIQYGAFPVKLKSADKSAVAESLRVLRNGECLIVFPEGERGKTGDMQDLENGIARIALQTGATIVPISITGAFESFNRFKLVPRLFKRVTVKFHQPIVVPESSDRKQLRENIAAINEAITKPIQRRLKAWYKLHPLDFTPPVEEEKPKRSKPAEGKTEHETPASAGPE